MRAIPAWEVDFGSAKRYMGESQTKCRGDLFESFLKTVCEPIIVSIRISMLKITQLVLPQADACTCTKVHGSISLTLRPTCWHT